MRFLDGEAVRRLADYPAVIDAIAAWIKAQPPTH